GIAPHGGRQSTLVRMGAGDLPIRVYQDRAFCSQRSARMRHEDKPDGSKRPKTGTIFGSSVQRFGRAMNNPPSSGLQVCNPSFFGALSKRTLLVITSVGRNLGK
ncbi:MAG TPA: hypothetical protein VKE70_36820, partial [Candidatus Solibacter sp.]|nr:hypothetical protein [Candidatus Solibacter sp.]